MALENYQPAHENKATKEAVFHSRLQGLREKTKRTEQKKQQGKEITPAQFEAKLQAALQALPADFVKQQGLYVERGEIRGARGNLIINLQGWRKGWSDKDLSDIYRQNHAEQWQLVYIYHLSGYKFEFIDKFTNIRDMPARFNAKIEDIEQEKINRVKEADEYEKTDPNWRKRVT